MYFHSQAIFGDDESLTARFASKFFAIYTTGCRPTVRSYNRVVLGTCTKLPKSADVLYTAYSVNVKSIAYTLFALQVHSFYKHRLCVSGFVWIMKWICIFCVIQMSRAMLGSIIDAGSGVAG